MIFFGLRQAVEDCPPILRVLDAKKQIVGTHRSRKHNLQHPYAPKFCNETGPREALGIDK